MKSLQTMLALFLACSTTAEPRVASSLPQLSQTGPSPQQIEKMRRAGYRALNQLLAQYDALSNGPSKLALERTIDKVAGQRYATVSRLYWYTDLNAARAESAATAKPILSLRLLGRLDEDLSCANSRFFRVLLYANREVSQLLRDKFILHWSSERPAPRLTVDYGNGRKMETTITGNSAHYVLNHLGQPLEILPGLMTPNQFVAALTTLLQVYPALDAGGDQDQNVRYRALQDYHAARVKELARQWSSLDNEIPDVSFADQYLESQKRAISKMMVETPATPKPIPRDEILKLDRLRGAWQQLGVGYLKTSLSELQKTMWDSQSSKLRDSLRPVTANRGAIDQMSQLKFAGALAADTAFNQFVLRRQIHERFLVALAPGSLDPAFLLSFEQVNRWVYDQLFAMPLGGDPWLGLLDITAFAALPGGGISE